MCSRDPAEIEAVRNELFKAGIGAEIRNNPVAETLGIRGVELWVVRERDFFHAKLLCAEIKARTSGKGEGATAQPQAAASGQHHLNEPEPGEPELPNGDVNGSKPQHANEPPREELEQASSLLEKEIDEMLKRESQLVAEAASLRRKLEEMGKALAAARAALARETESRAAAEKVHAEKLSGLQSAVKHERQECQRQLKSRDDSLKATEKQLQTQQAAIVQLRDAMVALEQQQGANEKSLSEAREEAATQREARLAAEERAKAAAEAQKSLEQRLLEQKNLQQRMQAHIASISSMRSKLQAKRGAIV
jgi:hypothetical protein